MVCIDVKKRKGLSNTIFVYEESYFRLIAIACEKMHHNVNCKRSASTPGIDYAS